MLLAAADVDRIAAAVAGSKPVAAGLRQAAAVVALSFDWRALVGTWGGLLTLCGMLESERARRNS